MTAATKKRQTRTRVPAFQLKSYVCKASTQFWDGTLLCLDLTTGLVEPATNAANKRVVGVAMMDLLTTAAGGQVIDVRSGMDFSFSSSGLAITDVGDMAFVTDDSTVQTAVGTAAVKAGRIVEFVSATEIWIHIPRGGPSVGTVVADGADALANALKAIINQLNA